MVLFKEGVRDDKRQWELFINLPLGKGPQWSRERLIFMLYILLSQWLRRKERERSYQSEGKGASHEEMKQDSEFLKKFPTFLGEGQINTKSF